MPNFAWTLTIHIRYTLMRAVAADRRVLGRRHRNECPKIVYMNEFMSGWQTPYLPLVSGILRAYAETGEQVRANYKFKPFLFCIDRFENLIAQYDEEPAMATFSISMWNEQLSLQIAREVKSRWPNCLIVFGGAQCPHDSQSYLASHPFIDVSVRAEGEDAFRGIRRAFP